MAWQGQAQTHHHHHHHARPWSGRTRTVPRSGSDAKIFTARAARLARVARPANFYVGNSEPCRVSDPHGGGGGFTFIIINFTAPRVLPWAGPLVQLQREHSTARIWRWDPPRPPPPPPTPRLSSSSSVRRTRTPDRPVGLFLCAMYCILYSKMCCDCFH